MKKETLRGEEKILRLFQWRIQDFLWEGRHLKQRGPTQNNFSNYLEKESLVPREDELGAIPVDPPLRV